MGEERVRQETYLFSCLVQKESKKSRELLVDKPLLFKKRLAERKEVKKPFVLNKVFTSFDNFLSTKESRSLYVFGKKGQGRENELTGDLNKELEFLQEITDWLKLPYSQREKFIKRYLEGEEVEDMKKEIEKAIKDLENGNDNNPKPNHKNPVKNNSDSRFPWKVVGGITLFCFFIVVVIIWLKKRKVRKN